MDANTPAYMFVENMLQFCLDKRGVAWQPEPRNSQAEVADKLFKQVIGYKVVNISLIFRTIVQEYSRILWEDISQLPDPVRFDALGQKIFAVAYEIYNNLGNKIENTYVFLAVMVDVSVQCANNGKQRLIQEFVCIIPNVLNVRLPGGFLSNFKDFSNYAPNQDDSDE